MILAKLFFHKAGGLR